MMGCACLNLVAYVSELGEAVATELNVGVDTDVDQYLAAVFGAEHECAGCPESVR